MKRGLSVVLFQYVRAAVENVEKYCKENDVKMPARAYEWVVSQTTKKVK